VRVQDARLQGLLVEYRNVVLKAQQEVENGITEFSQSRAEAAFLQTSVVAATGAFQIALLQYKEGTV
jgi:outer membrane protein TolC